MPVIYNREKYKLENYEENMAKYIILLFVVSHLALLFLILLC